MTRQIFCASALFLIFLPGCSHRAPSDSDFFNEPAAIAANKLPFNPLHWKVITSSIDPQQKTMATLYGNDSAVESARAGNPAYPDGSVLSLVTWGQREDPHWFGARIPDRIQSIEFVTIGKDQSASYQCFEGPELKRAERQDASARRDAILAERASVMP